MIPTTKSNRDNYDDLLVSIEANKNQLNLLLAVCDNPDLQNRIIQQYSTELNLPQFEVLLSRKQPSLTLALLRLTKENPELKTLDNAVITVVIEEFNQLDSKELLGYFQWTREALRNFPYSIIVWMTSNLLDIVEYKAPDFWAWRKGVFRFSSS